MKPRKQIKAVLWDMDGVLIDSEPWYNSTVGDMMKRIGREFGEKEIEKVTGSSYKNFVEILGLEGPRDELARMYVDALIDGIAKVTRLVGGVAEVLGALKKRGVKMAIGSSSPHEVVNFAVEKFGMSEWIGVCVTGSDVKDGKPAPDIYLKCAELLGVEPRECLVIEDSMNGIKSGVNAGMAVCAFTGTKLHDFDYSAADFEISSYSEAETRVFEDWLAV